MRTKEMKCELRQLMIRNLHAAHQGATSILSRARQVMYWPGMDREVNIHSETCSDCREAAPSKVKEPLIPAEIPEYPFQNVVAKVAELQKKNDERDEYRQYSHGQRHRRNRQHIYY